MSSISIGHNNDAVRLIKEENDCTRAIPILNRALLAVFGDRHSAAGNNRESASLRTRMQLLVTTTDEEGDEHYYRDDQYDEGMTTFSRPLFIYPSCSNISVVEATIYFNLGIAHSRKDHNDAGEALNFLRKSLDVVNQYVSCQFNYSPSGEDFSPVPHLIEFNIGHAHWRAGNHSEAAKSYRRVLNTLLVQTPTDGLQDSSESSMHGDFELESPQSRHKPIIAAAFNCIAMVRFYEFTTISPQDRDTMEAKAADCLSFLNASLSLQMFLDNQEQTNEPQNFSRETATILNNIGRVKFAQLEHDEALEFYLRSYLQRRSLLGDDHLDVAATLFNIAQTKEELGNTGEAIVHYERFLSIATAKLGAGHSDIIKVLIILGESYDKVDDLEKSQNSFYRALQAAQDATDRDDGVIATIFNKLGNVLYDRNQDQDALAVYSAGLEMERSIYPVMHKNIAVTLTNIARVQLQMGFYDEALTSFGEALQIVEVVGSIEESANIRASIGLIHELQGDFLSAIHKFQLVLKAREEFYGPDHFQVSVTLNALGLVQSKAGELHSSLVSFLKSLKIRRNLENCSKQALITAYYNVATLHKSIGELSFALRLFDEILCMERKIVYETEDGKGGDDQSTPNDLICTLKQVFLIYKELEDEKSGMKFLIEAAEVCANNRDVIDRRQACQIYTLLGDEFLTGGDVSTAMGYYTVYVRLFGWEDYDYNQQGRYRRIQADWYCRKRFCITVAPAA